MTRHLCLLVALLAATGCNSPQTTVTRLSSHEYPPKAKKTDIQILQQLPANRKFEEIATLDLVAEGQIKPAFENALNQENEHEPDFDTKLKDMLPGLKKAARRLGADAVIIKNVMTGNARMPGRAYAIAIKYLD